MTHERAYRWRVGAVAAGGLVALGLLYASPLLIAATVVPLGYVVYGALSTVPGDAAVRVERSFGDSTPPPGDAVTVTLTVENVSEATLPDLRVVDGVPDELAVVDGSPRGNVALRPGESAAVTYDVVARRGDFEFADPVARLRSLSAGRVVTETVPAAGDARLSSLDPVSEAPVGDATLLRAGTHATDSGGEGLEFWSTREYRPGDSINRIDWRRFARTSELTTVSFREERAVRTVVVVDARAVGRVRPHAGAPTAAAMSGYAAERLYEALAGANVSTGVAVFGVDGTDHGVPTSAGPVPWVDGDARNATALARALFEAVQAVADDPETGPGSAPSPGSRPADAAPSTAGSGRTDAVRTGATRPGEPGTAPGSGTEATASVGDGADAVESEDDDVGGETDSGGGNEGDETGDGHAEAAAGTPTADGGSEGVRLLLSQFPPTAQVVFVTPLLDDWPVSFVRRLREREYPVTVLSPAATGSASLGQTVAGLERQTRLEDLSATGVTAVDWGREEPLEVALAESLAHLLGGSHG